MADAESNKAGSPAPEIIIAGAGLGGERMKAGGSEKEGKKTRKHKKKERNKDEAAFNLAAKQAASMASNEDDLMHHQDPLRGDYLEQTGTRVTYPAVAVRSSMRHKLLRYGFE